MNKSSIIKATTTNLLQLIKIDIRFYICIVVISIVIPSYVTGRSVNSQNNDKRNDSQVSSQPTISTNSLSKADDDSTKNAIVSHINCYRKCHNSPALQRDTQIESSQTDGYAQELGQSGTFQHSNSKYGENLYAGPNAADCVDEWYFECAGNYDYSSNDNPFSCGHFTQIVWKSTQRIGLGIATMPKFGYVVVSNFDPPGNYQGEYVDNVQKPDNSCVTSCKSGSSSGSGSGGGGSGNGGGHSGDNNQTTTTENSSDNGGGNGMNGGDGSGNDGGNNQATTENSSGNGGGNNVGNHGGNNGGNHGGNNGGNHGGNNGGHHGVNNGGNHGGNNGGHHGVNNGGNHGVNNGGNHGGNNFGNDGSNPEDTTATNFDHNWTNDAGWTWGMTGGGHHTTNEDNINNNGGTNCWFYNNCGPGGWYTTGNGRTLHQL